MTDRNFEVPHKTILTPAQLAFFQESATYAAIVSYIESLNQAVLGTKLTDECTQSEGLLAALRLLDQVEQLVRDTPPVDNKSSRFGNPAFKDFYDKVSSASATLHESLPSLPAAAIPELTVYFNESWGNRTRVDYGSGMELNFLCWILCLERLGVFVESDHKALVLRLFWRYISVMRTIQSTYWLEPAGSHGVWGLDDYHFLPFLFGSAQLRGHKYIRPKSIHDPDILEEFSKQYMYLACIQFINSIKTASLRWHSPMLDDISAVKTWEKVNEGMLKMYRAEVLGKLPVMQHFLFGSILPLELPASLLSTSTTNGGEVGPDDPHYGHAHTHLPKGPDAIDVPGGGASSAEVGWGDCCGIPVPSVFAQAEAEKRLAAAGSVVALGERGATRPPVPLFATGAGIRPVPFD